MQKNISRRDFLLSSAAVVVSGTITSGAAALNLVSDAGGSEGSEPGGAFTLTDGVERSLVAIPSLDRHFEDMVNQHFPSLIGDRTFQALKRVCVALHNKQGPGIHAYKLRWTFAFDSGLYHATDSSTFQRPRIADGDRVYPCSRSASRLVLPQGAVALVSPYFTLTSGKSPRQQSVDWAKTIRYKSLQRFLSQNLLRIKRTSVTIGSAVYDDYTILDTDNGRFARRLKKKRNTEVQLAKAVLKKLDDGVADPHLLGAFHRTYNAPRHVGKHKQMIFHQARKYHAKYFSDVLLHEGRDKLLELVSKQAQQPLTHFRRLTISSSMITSNL